MRKSARFNCEELMDSIFKHRIVVYSRRYLYVSYESALLYRATNMNDVDCESLFYEFNFHIIYFIFSYHHCIPSLARSIFFLIVNVSRSCFIKCTNNANNLSSYFAATLSPLIQAKAFRSSFQKTRFDRAPKRDCSRDQICPAFAIDCIAFD